MLIKSLRYKNFRQFKGENIIYFSCEKEKNVTIILGNNTFGKTTLLQMFNWCFYNKAIFRPEDNPNFLLNLELSTQMYNGDKEEVLVETTIVHEQKEYTINRKQEYIKTNGVTNSKPTKLKVYYKDLKTGRTESIEKDRDMISVINLMLPEDLSGYFFFDTERVQNVAARRDLSSSVKGILGLSILDNAIKHLGKEESKSTVIGSFYEDLSENEVSQASQTLEKIQAAQEKIDIQTKIKSETENEICSYEKRKEELENIIRSLKDTADYQKNKDSLVSNIKAEKKALDEAYEGYRDLFTNDSIWFFAQPLFTQVKSLLEQADIDDKGIKDVTADTIKELIERGKCLCGAEIREGNEAFFHLMEQIKYIPPESIGTTIKNFRQSIDIYNKTNQNNRFYNRLSAIMSEILRYKSRIAGWEEDVKEIEKKIEGKEDAKKYQVELNDVKGRLKDLAAKRELASKKIEEAKSEKKIFKKVYDQLSAKSDKGREIKRYMEYAIRIREWMQNYYGKEEAAIREQLQDKVNQIFSRMYHGERVLRINEKYQTLLYTKVNGSDNLIISGESEGLIRVKNFAFIAGLVALAKEKALKIGLKELTNEPYPLILDAPFSNADEEHVKNISRELPAVAEQVIMFVMEKDWKYAEQVILDKVGKRYMLEKHSDTHSTIS